MQSRSHWGKGTQFGKGFQSFGNQTKGSLNAKQFQDIDPSYCWGTAAEVKTNYLLWKSWILTMNKEKNKIEWVVKELVQLRLQINDS